MAAPKRQDTRKFIENLSGAGKSIAVLTSGGDAQGKHPRVPLSDSSGSGGGVVGMGGGGSR